MPTRFDPPNAQERVGETFAESRNGFAGTDCAHAQVRAKSYPNEGCACVLIFLMVTESIPAAPILRRRGASHPNWTSWATPRCPDNLSAVPSRRERRFSSAQGC